MTEKIAFIGFGEAGQTERLGGKKTENRAELIAAIRGALGKGETSS